MFDPITEELIAGAPDLSSLKSSDMVELLTAAHVEVAAARLRMEGSDSVPDSLPQICERMSRLADVFEAQVALEVNADRLRPMAFVSGSARQIVGRVEELISSESRTSQLDEDCIGADISSALLFLVSERFSDAAEAGRSIRASGELNRIRRLLILTIGRLARGQFDEIAKTSIEDTDGDADDVTALATDLLYQELLVSIVILAQVSIGDREFGGLEDAYSRIDRVISMAGGSILSVTEVEKTTLVARTTFSGPHHLASLLRVAARSIAYNLLVNTPTPKGGTQEAWSNWIVKEAKRRPLTWENHRAAIATGFLDVGSSMIMTTPTGTGKSTLSALKIASNSLLGENCSVSRSYPRFGLSS